MKNSYRLDNMNTFLHLTEERQQLLGISHYSHQEKLQRVIAEAPPVSYSKWHKSLQYDLEGFLQDKSVGVF